MVLTGHQYSSSLHVHMHKLVASSQIGVRWGGGGEDRGGGGRGGAAEPCVPIYDTHTTASKTETKRIQINQKTLNYNLTPVPAPIHSQW